MRGISLPEAIGVDLREEKKASLISPITVKCLLVAAFFYIHTHTRDSFLLKRRCSSGETAGEKFREWIGVIPKRIVPTLLRLSEQLMMSNNDVG